ncbi:MAG: glycosyltransferase family 2 protein [archaeon]
MVKLSILMPAYNEERSIAEIISLVDKVNLSRVNVDKELVVVDDGSKDRTVEIIRALQRKYDYIKLIKHEKNKGKGAAVKTAIKNATGDIMIIQDADLEYDPRDYPKCIMPILEKRAKVVYGSRFAAKNNHVVYKVNWLATRFLDCVTGVLYFKRVSDIYTCYKTFDSETLRSVEAEGDRFDWEIEVTAKLLKNGVKIYKVPISYYSRSFDEGKKIGWRDGVQAAWTLVRYRF